MSEPAGAPERAALAEEAPRLLATLRTEIGRRVVGMEEPIRWMLVGLLCEGHILLEGVPGLAKTLLVRRFSQRLDLSFRRIQFTPDMLPSDILGNIALDPESQKLSFRPGPIFAHVILADEINRAPPKVQSALLEAMQERQVTIDGVSHPLPRPFLVIATQNPIEQEGTYPLPEAEMDRFLFRLLLQYPGEAEELAMLTATRAEDPDDEPPPTLERAAVERIARGVDRVRADPEVLTYLNRFVRSTRTDPRVVLGASPRASALFLRAMRANALLDARMYLLPDDVKALAFPVLNHRLLLRADVLAQSMRAHPTGGDPTSRAIAELIESLFRTLPAPR